MIKQIAKDLVLIREKKPLVHSMTNFVVMNETANAILCLGALPIMAHAREEVEEIVSISNAVVLNIGTLTPEWIENMIIAGKKANELGIPVILDPVGAGATKLRTDSAIKILKEVKVSIVRGNPGEIGALLGVAGEVRGVESISSSETADVLARNFANTFDCVAAITGAVDYIAYKDKLAAIYNGHFMLGKVVGTGCISNTIIASYAGVEKDMLTAAVGGILTMGLAGEMAVKVSGEKPGTFNVEFYNALYAIDSDYILNNAKIISN